MRTGAQGEGDKKEPSRMFCRTQKFCSAEIRVRLLERSCNMVAKDIVEKQENDERLSIEGVSGTSAGAINAVMLADGFARGGRAV